MQAFGGTMPIKVKCPACGRAYNLPGRAAGKSLKCKSTECGKQFRIPKQKPATADTAGNDDFLGALGDAVHESEDAEIAELPSPGTAKKKKKSGKKRAKRDGKPLRGVPVLVQFAGYVFPYDVSANVVLSTLVPIGFLIYSISQGQWFAAFIAFLACFFVIPLAWAFGRLFWPVGTGLIEGRRGSLFILVSFPGLLRAAACVTQYLELPSDSAQVGGSAMLLLIQVELAVKFGLAVILYLPAGFMGLINLREFN
jgi:hypothetical protein